MESTDGESSRILQRHPPILALWPMERQNRLVDFGDENLTGDCRLHPYLIGGFHRVSYIVASASWFVAVAVLRSYLVIETQRCNHLRHTKTESQAESREKKSNVRYTWQRHPAQWPAHIVPLYVLIARLSWGSRHPDCAMAGDQMTRLCSHGVDRASPASSRVFLSLDLSDVPRHYPTHRTKERSQGSLACLILVAIRRVSRSFSYQIIGLFDRYESRSWPGYLCRRCECDSAARETDTCA